jgi:hypothetical protein
VKAAPSSFVDRTEELAALERHLESVRAHGTGRLLAVRGRRQVGKSRLVEEFLERAGLPSVYFQATGLPRAEELARFVAEIGASALPAAETARGGGLGSWSAALNLLAETASPQAPSVVVLDELPYLVDSEPGFEAVLQEVWDRRMEGRPVLLILIGSDLRMMEALAGYGRPLFGKPRELVVPPLSPRAIAGLLGLDAAAALDAYLVIGGLPRLAVAWTKGRSFWDHLEEALSRCHRRWGDDLLGHRRPGRAGGILAQPRPEGPGGRQAGGRGRRASQRATQPRAPIPGGRPLPAILAAPAPALPGAGQSRAVGSGSPKGPARLAQLSRQGDRAGCPRGNGAAPSRLALRRR